MFLFDAAHCCPRKIHAASGRAGSKICLSRTYGQNGKRLAAYGLLSLFQRNELVQRAVHERALATDLIALDQCFFMKTHAIPQSCPQPYHAEAG